MSLANFVDQLDSFPSLADFSAGTDSLKWTALEQNVVYQIVSTLTVNTQHGQSVILSLQKADGSSCGAWACGMLTKKPTRPHGNGKLATVCTGYWTERARLDESSIRIS